MTVLCSRWSGEVLGAGPGRRSGRSGRSSASSPVRYYQLLNALLDDPRALAHDPVTVNRLRRSGTAPRDAADAGAAGPSVPAGGGRA